jgi:hypothetical protein
MGVAGIILVSSGLLAASLIPSNVDVFYIAVGLLAGKLNAALSTQFRHSVGMFFKYSHQFTPISCNSSQHLQHILVVQEYYNIDFMNHVSVLYVKIKYK